MLYPVNPYLLEGMEKRQARRYLTEAEYDRLLKQINPPQRGLLSRKTSGVLHHLGHSLLRVRERLESFAISQDALTR